MGITIRPQAATGGGGGGSVGELLPQTSAMRPPRNDNQQQQVGYYTFNSNTDTLSGLYASGVVVGDDGLAYILPNNTSSGRDVVRAYSPLAGTVTDKLSLRVQGIAGPVMGGVNVAGSGKIYMMPNGGSVIVVYNYVTNTAYALPTLVSPTEKWGYPVMLGGKIYACPLKSNRMLIIDPATDTVSYSLVIPGVSVSTVLYGGGLVVDESRNGLYLVPSGSSGGVADVWFYNPVTNFWDSKGVVVDAATYKWSGGVMGLDGNVYMIPYYSSNVLKMDLLGVVSPGDTANITTFPSGSTTSGQCRGGVLGADGCIYGLPYYGTTVLRIDPITENGPSTSRVGTITVPYTGGIRYIGGVLLPNNDMLLAGVNVPSIVLRYVRAPGLSRYGIDS